MRAAMECDNEGQASGSDRRQTIETPVGGNRTPGDRRTERVLVPAELTQLVIMTGWTWRIARCLDVRLVQFRDPREEICRRDGPRKHQLQKQHYA